MRRGGSKSARQRGQREHRRRRTDASPFFLRPLFVPFSTSLALQVRLRCPRHIHGSARIPPRREAWPKAPTWRDAGRKGTLTSTTSMKTEERPRALPPERRRRPLWRLGRTRAWLRVRALSLSRALSCEAQRSQSETKKEVRERPFPSLVSLSRFLKEKNTRKKKVLGSLAPPLSFDPLRFAVEALVEAEIPPALSLSLFASLSRAPSPQS